jgi:hypothetical protein
MFGIETDNAQPQYDVFEIWQRIDGFFYPISKSPKNYDSTYKMIY